MYFFPTFTGKIWVEKQILFSTFSIVGLMSETIKKKFKIIDNSTKRNFEFRSLRIR